MKILEVREGFIKFESESQVSLSSFIQVCGEEKRYIAQVVQVKRSGESQIAYAKILFLYDGALSSYDKTLPSKDSEITEFTFDIINKSLDSTQPLVVGKFIDNEIDIPMDKTCFNKKILISSDNPVNLTTIINNIKNQFLNTDNVIVIDMLGNLEGAKFVAGKDFKLPLNTESLAFMYEDCLNDATSESKSLIKEIFQDLSDYSKTVPFLPFGALKTIVDDMVDKSHVFKLLVLKNKLSKFDKQGYFAATVNEAENLNQILEQKNVAIDLSKLDSIFQNRYLEVIYSLLEKSENPIQVFVNVSNSINKKNIKNILTNEHVSSVFVTHSKFKYINEIKSMFDNFIIEPSFANNEIFKIYSTFLNSMPKDTCLVVGEGTNYIPLVSVIKEFESESKFNPKEVPVIEEAEQVQKSETIEDENESTIISIDKKSEELIDRVAEEVETSKEILNDIFSNDEEDDALENADVESSIDNVVEQESESLEPNEDAILEDVVEQTLEEESLMVEQELVVEEDALEQDITEELSQEASIESQYEAIVEEETVQGVAEEPILEQLEIEESGLSSEDIVEELPIQEEIIEITDELSVISDSDVIEEYVPENLVEVEQEPVVEQELEVLPISTEDDLGEFEEISELEESELEGDDIIVVDLEDEDSSVELSEEELLDKEIVRDVDKVFTTMKEDSISDADLDFIDELNEESAPEDSNLEALDNDDFESISTDNDMEELPEFAPDEDSDDSFLEPLVEINDLRDEDDNQEILETRKSTTPMVPVYEADIPQEDLVSSDFIEQGDSVTHAKYGHGVVEKMIKYGTKNLYSINFDNVGRRLLDPTLTEIKKA